MFQGNAWRGLALPASRHDNETSVKVQEKDRDKVTYDERETRSKVIRCVRRLKTKHVRTAMRRYIVGETQDTHRVNGNNRVDVARLHEQGLERRSLSVFPSVDQSQQSLVGVRERSARHPEEGVRNLCRVKADVLLWKRLLQSPDDGSD